MGDDIVETEFEKYFKLISSVVFIELKTLQEDTNMEDMYFADTISKSVASSIQGAVSLIEVLKKMKLHYINSQKIVDEMFCGGVNYGVKIAIKLAQRVVNVLDDGIIGDKTIKALNSFNDVIFDVEFDKLEIKHYENLVSKNPKFERFINGWRNRSVAV